MRILFLDDDPERVKAFLMANRHHEVHVATNYVEAIQAIRKYDYEMMWLDHDLSVEDQMLDPIRDRHRFKERGGTDVALAIVLHCSGKRKPKEVVVHSYNPLGARNMMAILARLHILVSHRPFSPKDLRVA